MHRAWSSRVSVSYYERTAWALHTALPLLTLCLSSLPQVRNQLMDYIPFAYSSLINWNSVGYPFEWPNRYKTTNFLVHSQAHNVCQCSQPKPGACEVIFTVTTTAIAHASIMVGSEGKPTKPVMITSSWSRLHTDNNEETSLCRQFPRHGVAIMCLEAYMTTLIIMAPFAKLIIISSVRQFAAAV